MRASQQILDKYFQYCEAQRKEREEELKSLEDRSRLEQSKAQMDKSTRPKRPGL